MKFVLTAFIFAVGISGLGYAINEESVALIEVESHIDHYTENFPTNWRRRAMSYAPLVVHWSLRYDIDPLLVSTIIQMESSYRAHVIGDEGQSFGLMQVRWYKALRGFNMAIPNDQIHAGTKHLRYCFDLCKQDLRKSVTAYATGGCNRRFRGLKRRLKTYKAVVTEHRKWNAQKTLNEIDVALKGGD